MRKITKEAILAFNTSVPFSKANTVIEVLPEFTVMKLHNNAIAYKFKDTGKIQISTCGWQSNTTKERLNAIAGVNIQQKKGIWYLNGKQWGGELTEIK